MKKLQQLQVDNLLYYTCISVLVLSDKKNCKIGLPLQYL